MLTSLIKKNDILEHFSHIFNANNFVDMMAIICVFFNYHYY